MQIFQAADCKSDADIHENQGLSIEEILATYTGQRQTYMEDYVLDGKAATKRIQITRINTKIAHGNDRSISAQRTPNPEVHWHTPTFIIKMPSFPHPCQELRIIWHLPNLLEQR